jgi:hypothetical protein
LIDLHTHTNESDGTLSPAELVAEAERAGLKALAITDHDTLRGYDAAAPAAAQVGLELICGIELSTKLHGRSVHLLGYFLDGPPSAGFREWIELMQASRHERNIRLAARLRELGLDITLEEVRARGRSMTGRPHFARVMLEKGYVASMQQAFDDYLDESAKGYVERMEPQLSEAVERIQAGGGLASLAHPVRLDPSVLPEICDFGLDAIEAYHSDHGPDEVERYLALAKRCGLAVTGGSDFHGAVKPGLRLGWGYNGSAAVPPDVLDRLRGYVPARVRSREKA